MKRIVVGVVVLGLLGAGGFFGATWYAQHEAERQVDASFAELRQNGGKASHGRISFDLWSRKLEIADVKTETTSNPALTVNIGRITASNLSQPDATRVTADSIEISNIEVEGQLTAPATMRMTYKAPQLIISNYAGPARFVAPAPGSPLLDTYRGLVRQAIAVSATQVSMPRLSGSMISPGEPGTDFAYAGFVADGIKDGRIARYKLDEVTFTVTPRELGNTKGGRMRGRITDIVHADLDANGLLAMLDPDKASDDSVHHVYGKVTTGPYEVNSELGIRMRMDGISIDEFGMRPARLRLPELIAAIPANLGAQLKPAQARELLDKVANIYDGMQLANVEMRGLSVETPEGPFKLSRIGFDMRDGKGDLALEGLDVRAPQGGPLKIGRFALKGLDMGGLLRLSGRAAPGTTPSPADALEALKAVSGIELKDYTGPYKTTNKQVKIDAFKIDWGQFVGPIPTDLRLTTRLSGPVDGADLGLVPLLAAGITSLGLDADLGATWSEASGSAALQPFKIELANLFSAQAGASLARVPRGVFTLDPQQAATMAMQIEAGPLELTVRDLGAVDIAVAQFARSQNISRDAARAALVESIKAMGGKLGADNADVAAAVDAVARFVETPRQTLTLKLTPRAAVPAMQLVQLMTLDPPNALAQFKIEASTGM